jgi:hypothetical protein
MTDNPEDRGTRIGNDLNAYVPEDCQIRPLRNQIVVEPLPWEPSKIIEVIMESKPLRGVVRAVGPGTYPWKYNGRKGVRTKSWRSKSFTPTTVKIGDIVELGGLELKGYLHKTFLWGTKQMVLCTEDDIAGICEP